MSRAGGPASDAGGGTGRVPASAAPAAVSDERTLVAESDWLNSAPVFYNVRTGAWGTSINDAIVLADVELDPQGVADYLDYGFSVLGRTPVRDVRFLRHSSRLWRTPDGRLEVEELPDPLLTRLGDVPREDDVIDLLRETVHAWEASVDGDIVIPTSGGYDSRLLNLCIGDRSRVRAFTYGTTPEQDRSKEVVTAQALCRRLGVAWEHVPLGDFHRYFGDWDRLFGPAIHAHGMYHVEFYKAILQRVAPGSPFLSGVAADFLAGGGHDSGRQKRGVASWDRTKAGEIPPITSPREVPLLIVTHGMHADSDQSVLTGHGDGPLEEYFGAMGDLLRDPRVRSVEILRFRLMLLRFLVQLPQAMGFTAWSPYLDLDVGTAMVSLPAERRRGRRWVADYFAREGVDLPKPKATGFRDRPDTLAFQALRRVPVAPLDVGLLSEVVRPGYVRWINRNVGPLGLVWEGYHHLGYTRGSRKAVTWLRERGVLEQRRPAYYAYLTLWPIQHLLRRRDAARRGEAPA